MLVSGRDKKSRDRLSKRKADVTGRKKIRFSALQNPGSRKAKEGLYFACSWLAAVLPISRDFSGILIVLILKTSGMGKWYLWDFDCLIPGQPF